MSAHPVLFRVEVPTRMRRIHVAIRCALLLALAAIGCSSGYWLVYLALPTLAALLIAQKGWQRYFSEDAPVMVRGLRWFAAAYAYLWLLTDVLPTGEAPSRVVFEVQTGGAPTAGSALSRLLTSLPALLFLAVLSIAASLLWLLGALSILIQRRIPTAISDFLTLTLRYQFRLATYHLSLVARYPSFDAASLSRANSATIGA